MHLIKSTYHRSFFGVLLGLLFFVVQIPVPHHHHHTHGKTDEHVAHDAKTHATDACHNFVFHGDSAPECTHPGHAHQAQKACLSCKAFVPSKFIWQKVALKIANEPKISQRQQWLVLPAKAATVSTYFLRGPPQMV